MKLLIDNCISVRVARALREVQCDAKHVSEVEELGQEAEDTTIFAWMGKDAESWAFFSHDYKQLRRQHERAGIYANKVAVFYLTSKDPPTAAEMLSSALANWREIEALLRKTGRPMVAFVKPAILFPTVVKRP